MLGVESHLVTGSLATQSEKFGNELLNALDTKTYHDSWGYKECLSQRKDYD